MEKVLIYVQGGMVQWTASTDPNIEVTVVDADMNDLNNPYSVSRGKADIVSGDLDNCPEIDEEVRNELKKQV